ncbi:hypothetical protein PVAG01_04964 [Phlyctema vagabunda]|uniref:ADF-H domain-containing protein n=1 Tax=Phlyctema vagabunda TaxID=108571 RepID=A0ABR4PJG2_9HELO
MSLNGLDDVKVKEAHDVAVAEPGGWFLLKYVSRDEIELLGRGNGGIVEIRNAVAKYEEPSPLFGFLRYRRRNVIIKYVPEDCSRLVQARVTVHFNAVTERFSPHDTVFPITTSKDLRDSTLSAACSLHTASGSTSSSTSSLRRRRLMEIAEDEEEENRVTKKRQSTVPEERPSTAKTGSVSEAQLSLPTVSLESPSPTAPNIPEAPTTGPTSASLETSPPPPRERASIDESQPRLSSQSNRPELFTYTSYGSNGKPKVKLGPRPSLDVGARSHTSATTPEYRPVSSLPAGLKIFSKGSRKGKERPKSQYYEETSKPPALGEPTITDTMPLAQAVPRPHTSGGRPNTSSGASLKTPMSPITANSPKLPTITPEKARLMKALELRKKQKTATSAVPPITSADGSQKSPPLIENVDSNRSQDTHEYAAEDTASVNDSGIAFDAVSVPKTDESDATRSDSYPASPIGPSSKAESTRASSISESTDETAQPIDIKGRSLAGPEGNHKPGLETPLVESPQLEVPNSGESPQKSDAEESVTETANSTPTGEDDLEQNIDLPQLKALTYQPPSFSITVPKQGQQKAQTEVQKQPEKDARSQQAMTKEIPRPDDLSPAVNDKSTIEVNENTTIAVIPASPVSAEASKSPKVEAGSELRPLSQDAITLADNSKRSSLIDVGTEGSELKKTKKRALVEPIRTDLEVADDGTANSEANFSSDDELMDELQSAVFQEAKPISVSKSPLSPVFPHPQKADRDAFPRAFSNPIPRDSAKADALLHPEAGGARPSSRSSSASAAYLNRINQQNSAPVAKKVNLGSGISQRIKALEQLSSLAPGAPAPGSSGPPPGTSPAFFSVRKSVVRPVSRTPSIAERANSLTKNSPGNSRESSPEAFKLRERSGSVQGRLDSFKGTAVPQIQQARGRPESISVTARIIRDPNQPFPQKPELGKDISDYAPLNLKQSPLVIDHQRGNTLPPLETSRKTIEERRSLSPSKTDRRSSVTSTMSAVKDIINDKRNSFAERRRSINLEPLVPSSALKSPSRPPSAHTSPTRHRPMSIMSRSSISGPSTVSPPPTSHSSSSVNDDKSEKKSNRATRMLRRMSSSFSNNRKNNPTAISPTLREDPEPVAQDIDARSIISSYTTQASTAPPTVSNVGDVNVQFPDTLLWKRRSMGLDSQGFLVLAPALSAHKAGDKANIGATRRFHLNEFRRPYIPDMEMEELPNSVVLDFVEGGGLQVACEDRAGQGRILSVLQEAHRTWTASQ